MNFDNILIPYGEIQDIEFLTRDEFYPMELGGKTYVIFAHDQCSSGAYFGVAEDGTVYNILRHRKKTYYAMNSLKSFIKALEKWGKLDDSSLIKGVIRDLTPFRKLPEKDNRAEKLGKIIRRLDPNALDKGTYWSSVIEDIRSGVI